MFASLPIFIGEWASEFEIRVMLSRSESLQFMGGSDESPVSMAWMWGVNSSKHSSRESKPDAAPNTEKCGVHAWAGTNKARSDTSRTILKSSFASMPSMGLPSDLRLPIFESVKFIFAAEATSGAMTMQWIFLVFAFLLYMQLISLVKTKFILSLHFSGI